MALWKRFLLCGMLLALLLTACGPSGSLMEPTAVPTQNTAPPTQPPTEPPTEPTTEPLPVFTQRDWRTMLEGVSVSTWTLEDETVYIRQEELLAATGIEGLTAILETEAVEDAGGFLYIPLYPIAQALAWPIWEDAEHTTTYITPSAAPVVTAENVQVPVLMYHAVSDNTWGEAELFVSPSDMEAQLAYLVENGYDPIWFEDLHHLEDYDKPVILTFDDGYEDNYTELLPLLEKYHVKATIFVIAGYMGYPNKMTWEQVAAISTTGLVSIQSHTMTHGYLDEMDEQTLIYELEQSRAVLTRLTGKLVSVLCYPTGQYSDLALEVARRYYSFGLKMNDYMYQTSDDPFLVNRYYISRYTDLDTFASYIEQAGQPGT